MLLLGHAQHARPACHAACTDSTRAAAASHGSSTIEILIAATATAQLPSAASTASVWESAHADRIVARLYIMLTVALLQHLLPLRFQAHICSSNWLRIVRQHLIGARLLSHICGHLLHNLLLEIALMILITAR